MFSRFWNFLFGPRKSKCVPCADAILEKMMKPFVRQAESSSSVIRQLLTCYCGYSYEEALSLSEKILYCDDRDSRDAFVKEIVDIVLKKYKHNRDSKDSDECLSMLLARMGLDESMQTKTKEVVVYWCASAHAPGEKKVVSRIPAKLIYEDGSSVDLGLMEERSFAKFLCAQSTFAWAAMEHFRDYPQKQHKEE